MFRQVLHPQKSDCIQRSGDTHSYGETWEQVEKKFEIRRSVEFSSTTARCIPWRVDGHSNGVTCHNRRRIRRCGPFRIWNLECSRRGSDGETHCFKKATGKPNASSKSDQLGNPKAARKEWSHNLHVSPATIHHSEAVFSNDRKIYGREHDDPKDDLDVKKAVWSVFLNTTLQAAVHLGQDYEANVRFVKNHFWNSVGQLFNEKVKKLISEQTEITCVSKHNNFKELTRMSRSILCSKAFQITNAKTNVFSDSCSVWEKLRWSYCNLEEQN